MNAFKHWWANHVQKTAGSLLLLLDGASLAGYTALHDDIVQFFGHHGPTIYSGGRMLLSGLIVWRATQRQKPPMPAPAPEMTR